MSNRRKPERRIRVRGIRRKKTDLEKLNRALLLWEAEREKRAQEQHKRSQKEQRP